MLACRQPALHLRLERAVELPTVLCPLHELPGRHSALELSPLEEVVVHAVHFVAAHRSGRGRDGVTDVFACLEQMARNRGLPAPGGRGEHEQERGYSKFSSCSRNRSSSPFIATTACCMAASLALEPIVLISRPISCARNPSCLPTGPGPRSAASLAPRWA